MNQATGSATAKPVGGPRAGTGETPAMLTVRDVARMLNCSTRTVYRLTGSGRMPRPVKLGVLVRWPRVAIDEWMSQGCPRAGREEVVR